MNASYNKILEIKEKRNNGKGAYNYLDDISNLRWDLINITPCPGHVFV